MDDVKQAGEILRRIRSLFDHSSFDFEPSRSAKRSPVSDPVDPTRTKKRKDLASPSQETPDESLELADGSLRPVSSGSVSSGSVRFQSLNQLDSENLIEEGRNLKHKGDSSADGSRQKAHAYLHSTLCYMMTARKLPTERASGLMQQMMGCVSQWSTLSAAKHNHLRELTLFQLFLAYSYYHLIFSFSHDSLHGLQLRLLADLKKNPLTPPDTKKASTFLDKIGPVFLFNKTWRSALSSSSLISEDPDTFFSDLALHPERFLARCSLLLERLEEDDNNPPPEELS